MRTKIIATIGPASNKKEILKKFIAEGVRIFRLNFSHGSAPDFAQLIKTIRALEADLGKPLTILQDLAGPKIRIGQLANDSIAINRGQKVLFGLGASASLKQPKASPSARKGQQQESRPAPNSCLPLNPFNNKTILQRLELGDKLDLADGALQLEVCGRLNDFLLELKAQNSGVITSRKGVALPGKPIDLPALTPQDRKNLLDGLKLGVDAVALSYVQTAQDILQARKIIKKAGRNIPIIAKLERAIAIDRLDEILAATDMVMVARGDLGVECPLEDLPAAQKHIIRACNQAARPVIVATQMLLSMVRSPKPTRAEVTDVANAVLDGADCLMLSEETAVGAYPVECVRYMGKIASNAEGLLFSDDFLIKPMEHHGVPDFLAYCACLLAEKSNAHALVAHSSSGATARLLSVRQPRHPIYALTPCQEVVHALNFCWGVRPCLVPDQSLRQLERVENFIENNHLFTKGQAFVITAGQPKQEKTSSPTNLVKIYIK